MAFFLSDCLPRELQRSTNAGNVWGAEAQRARGPQHPAPLADPATRSCVATLLRNGGGGGASGAALPAPPCAPFRAGESVVQRTDDWDGWEDASHLLLPPADNGMPASALPPASLPLPIPLGPVCNPSNANSPSLNGWNTATNTTERCGAAVTTAMHGMIAAPATPDSSAAELAELLAAMGIDDDAVASKAAQVVSSGWSSPMGSPPQGTDGWQWGSSCDSSDDGGANSAGYLSGASAQHSTQRASRAERAAREATRQANSDAFVRSRQVISGMKEEAARAFQSAIDARRQGRLADAIQFEHQAQALRHQAKAYRAQAARDAYRRNNGANVNELKDVDLHLLEVPEAMTRVRAAVGAAMGLAGGGVYSLVTVAFISGWGKHSPDGTGKILAAIQDYLSNLGVDWDMENPGKIRALIAADAY